MKTKNKNMVWEIIKKELRDIVRDKKTLAMMIIMPIVLYPLMIGFFFVFSDQQSEDMATEIMNVGLTFEPTEALDTMLTEFNVEKVIDEKDNLHKDLLNGELDAYITLEENNYKIHYSEEDMNGMMVSGMLEQVLTMYREMIQTQMLTNEGLVAEEIFEVFTIESENVGSTDMFTSMMVGMIPSMIIVSVSLTAVYTAIDMTAGEKERGTLETLLTFPLKNGDIVMGKFIATTIASAISSTLGFLSMYGMLYYLSKELESFTAIAELSLQSILVLIGLFGVFSMFISAIAIILATNAKSFKEAQNATQPLSIVSMIPMFASIMGVELNKVIALIPFMNISLLVDQALLNKVDMGCFWITTLSGIVYTYILIKVMSKLYKSDKILFS